MMRATHTAWTARATVLSLLLSYSVALLPLINPAYAEVDATRQAEQARGEKAQSEATAQPVQNQNNLNLSLKKLGDPEGYTLRTVQANRRYFFTRPSQWEVSPQSYIQVHFQHSPSLLPDRSSLNVLINNQVVKSIRLTPENVQPSMLKIPLDPSLLKDRNTLEFMVTQHFTNQCEDPFSSELWTTVLPDSFLNLSYQPKVYQPNLARFPFPLVDELAYGLTQINFAAPASLSPESLEALATVSTKLGQSQGWRPLHPTLTNNLNADENIILIGTPQENPLISQVGGNLPLPLSGSQWSGGSTGITVKADDGILEIIPNPSHKDKAVLIVSGNSPEGVAKAAHFLVQNPSNKLLVGGYAVVGENQLWKDSPFRDWNGFIQDSGMTTFDQLGLDTLTARGVTSLPLVYSVKKMPDLILFGRSKVTMDVVYSYASQLDPTQSKMEVILNGKSIKSVPLDNKMGANLAHLSVDIPATEFFTYNDLSFKFHLYPEKYNLCTFVTDAHIWGTIHKSTSINVKGEVNVPMPDLGLINDAGYPFTVYQDFTDVGIVLPASPTEGDLQLMLNIMSRLGRLSDSRTGINVRVVKADKVPDEVKKNDHLIVIGPESRNAFAKEFQSRTHAILSGDQATINGPLAEVRHSPGQGLLEEVISPWNEKRIAMLVTAENSQAEQLINNLFEQDPLFAAIDPGNVVVVNPDGPKSLTALRKGEARFFVPSKDFGKSTSVPNWVVIVVAIFAVLGVFSLFQFLLRRK